MQRLVLGTLLLVAVAAAGITLNFALLRLTQESDDPVGKLSPRAVFIESPGVTTTSTVDDSTTTRPSPPHHAEADDD